LTRARGPWGYSKGFFSTLLVELSVLEPVDKPGTRWRFEGRGVNGFTPSHPREHRLQGLSVTVRYHSENGVLVIDEITD
jgi:hypothetical protein